jgi:predicted enzyme related to lactoylglutathione lyase
VLRLNHINFACDDPKRVAEFWHALLDGDDDGPQLSFRKAEKSPTLELPIHLDINVPDREAELQRILELGGKLVETKSHQIGELFEIWTVMRDPEGNGFCIQSPPKTDARRIGNVTFSCANPVALGKFWAGALGWPDEPIDQGFIQQLLDAGWDERERESFYVTRETPTSRPRLLFQRRERSRPPAYPIHLDFQSDDRNADVERLAGLGATVEAVKASHTVMRDAESNPFCVA